MHTYFFEVTDVESPYLQEYPHIVSFAQRIGEVDLTKCADATCISVFVHSRVDQDVLMQLPALKKILTRSTGTDHIDLVYCAQHGIEVINVPSYGEHTVAEYAFAMLLAGFRKVHEAHARSLRGDVSQEGLMGTDLYGKTLGVIGTGRIGEHVITIAHGFGMRVLAYDLVQNPACQESAHCTYVPLDQLYAESDVISLHVPLTPQTHHMLDATAFAQMKPGVVLINTARGGVVDNQALLDALESDRVALACLDVIEGEELLWNEHTKVQVADTDTHQHFDLLALDARLIHHRKVLHTPHIAYNTREAMGRIMEAVLAHV